MFLFSKKTLSLLLKHGGFSVCKIKTWGGIGTGITFDFVKRPVDKIAKKVGAGDVMIVLAKKD
jgi:hypothetical protein